MSTQITVRLPNDAVTFLDEAVSTGVAPSRASLVTEALEREMRRRAALRDLTILHREGPADDLDELVAWSTDQRPALED